MKAAPASDLIRTDHPGYYEMSHKDAIGRVEFVGCQYCGAIFDAIGGAQLAVDSRHQARPDLRQAATARTRPSQEMSLHRPSQRDYVGAALLMLVSGVFAYIVLDQVGAALVCAGCVGASLMVASNL